MLARRLLIFALILLVVTAISSAIAPPPRITTDAGAPSPTAGASTTDSAVVERTIDASREEPDDIAVQSGDILRLIVESDETGAVELVGLGAIRAIAPGTPVTFDVLPRRSGEHPVVFEAAGGVERTVATVRILSPEE